MGQDHLTFTGKTARISHAALLLLPLLLAPACSSIGFGAQRSVEAAGVVATSAVATPVIGFASWPLWHWGGSITSEWLSGTEEIRVPVAAPQPGGPGAVSQPNDSAMNLYIIILLLVSGGLARELWSLKARDKDQQKQLDELWDMLTRGRGK